MATIYPVIMCGGAGTRLWPVSRRKKAKQYHSLTSEYTMLQETVQRMNYDGSVNIAAPSFVCAQTDEKFILEQTQAINVDPLHIVLEPIGRNTAPVAAVISTIFKDIKTTDLILLLPADHHIADISGFWASIERGINAAQKGHLITLGIQPDTPETGYGYIRQGQIIENGVFAVQSFVEKPNLETAQAYLKSGKYYWNAGIFLFSPSAMTRNFNLHAPETLENCRRTLAASSRVNNILKLDKATFSKCPNVSIDYAIMERSTDVALVAPVDVGWNDIGSWPALAALTQNLSGNITDNDNIVSIDCKNSYFHSEGPLIAGIGLKDIVVIATKDAILVMPKDQAQNVKEIVKHLKMTNREDLV